jgi:hypothetical protein
VDGEKRIHSRVAASATQSDCVDGNQFGSTP